MTTFISAVKQFVDDEEGVTAIEYGLMAALLAAAVIAAVGFLDTALTGAFTAIGKILTDNT